VNDYVEFSSSHRRVEEDLILPAAQRFLTKEDWDEVNAAFGANRDPFASTDNMMFCPEDRAPRSRVSRIEAIRA
jgi:hemerythrin-like domain-containing protein